MTKLQEIENKLKSINDAVFQNLCDAYLYFTEDGYPEIDRSGSQKGKQKTVKGTPDSYYQRPDGKYVLIEYTTKEQKESTTSFQKKIETDIKKCLDKAVTGLDIADICKIIYCCNSVVSLKERKKIEVYCSDRNVTLDIRTIDKISMSLLGRGMFAAKEFLGVSIDTAQILPTKVFKQEYEGCGYATPLSNTFLYRENELKDLQESFKSSQICILTGPPGVGKSRLAMAAIENAEELKAATVFCLSNKTAPIYEDLRLYTIDDKPYILFVDDANRQMGNLTSLLALLKEKRVHKILVIITVRDYAFEDIKRSCLEYNPSFISINKFSNEEIEGILQSPDFNIKNPLYRDRIIEIANGNPRLAVMAAKVALDKQSLFALDDVSELYDKYFENALSTSEILSNKILLKTIGIVSFFYALNLENGDFVKEICSNFSVNEYDFKTSIEQLERFELLEASPDFSIVRMPEQVLSTYFFYHCFFKERLLDFSVVLDKYFNSFHHRIRDTVIPTNNTFGYRKVSQIIEPYLTGFWGNIKNDQETAFRFLDIFWAFRKDDALAFVHERICAIAPVKKALFVWDDKSSNNLYGRDRDKYIDLLAKFFPYFTEGVEDAIELSYEYVRRKPEVYSQLMKCLRDNFIFKANDELHGFKHQTQLLDFLLMKEKKANPLSTAMFFDIVPEMMKTSFNVVSSGRQPHSISFYQYNLPLSEEIIVFRNKVWRFIDKNFHRFSEQVVSFITDYAQMTPDRVLSIYEYDLPFLIVVFRKHFDDKKFAHAYAVQNLIFWFKRLGIKDDDFAFLKKQFNTRAYKIYNVLTRDKVKGKEDFEYSNYDEYEVLKEQQVRTSFKLKNLLSFKRFYSVLEEITSWKGTSGSPFWWALDIFFDQKILENPTEGVKFMIYMILHSNKIKYHPYRPFITLNSTSNLSLFKELYAHLVQNKFEYRVYWINQYFCVINENDLIKNDLGTLLDIYKDHEGHLQSEFSFIHKFQSIDPNVHCLLLETILKKNDSGGKIRLDHQFFEKYGSYFILRIDLLKRAYFSEDHFDSHFDHDSKDFFQILNLDNNFLIEYVQHYMTRGHMIRTREHSGMSKIWVLPQAERILIKFFNFFKQKNRYYFQEDYTTVFFQGLTEVESIRALKMLKEYLTKNITQPRGFNIVFQCVRHSFRREFENFIQHFLSLNQNFDDFKEIQLLATSFSSNGTVIWADVRAQELVSILKSIETNSVKRYRFVQHIQYLKNRINGEKAQADRERLRNFLMNS